MNDTKLTPRQAYVVQIINQSNGLTRDEIQKNIFTRYPLSKPTLIRDLNNLISRKHIKLEGQGRNILYLPFISNSLLRFIDLDLYFELEPDQRPVKQKTFNFKLVEELNDLFSREEINKINHIKKDFSVQTKKLSPDIFKKELERFTIELSWKSSKIEGNTYTLLETESLILKNKKAGGHSEKEAIMILNHKKAFEQILANRSDFKILNLQVINQLHNILISDLSITSGIRKHKVGITGTVYKPLDNQHQIRDAMDLLVEKINKSKNVLEKALISHIMIPYIQPYTDGNKRTGRMITNAILLAYDYYPLSYRSINEDEFKKALIVFYEQQNIYHLKRLFLEQLEFAYSTYFQI